MTDNTMVKIKRNNRTNNDLQSQTSSNKNQLNTWCELRCPGQLRFLFNLWYLSFIFRPL